MKEVIGVRFRRNGKIYYFDPRNNAVDIGTKVIVETTKGIEFGWVVIGRREVDETRLNGDLRPIQRLATPQDIERYENNIERAKTAFEICKTKIRERGLEMKLISAEYAFDNSKVLFYFTADGRVDFRELVRDLAYALKIRIELRQVGVRDDARIRGGIGMCGRELCCHSYLTDFIPVSIKMAKEQSLSLNPVKISGVCGRLMCCLKHEEDTYEYLNSLLPNVGDHVRAADGVSGEVASVNVLRQRVRIYVTDEEGNKDIVEYKVEDLRGGQRGRQVDTDDSAIDPRLTALEASDMAAADPDEEGIASSDPVDEESSGFGTRDRRDDAGSGSWQETKKDSRKEFNKNYNKDQKKDFRKDSQEGRKKRPHGGKGGEGQNHETRSRRNASEKFGSEKFGSENFGSERSGQERNNRGDHLRHEDQGGANPHGGKGGQKKQKFKGGPRNEGDANKDMQNGQKHFHRKNRPNNRPRESRKGGQNQGNQG